METVQQLTTVDASAWQTTITTLALLFFAAIAVFKGFEYLAEKFGWESKTEKRFKALEREIAELKVSAQTFNDNRVHDREVSKGIQKDLLDAIECIKVANRVSLGNVINEKYKYYTKIQGIPEDEVDEFTNLHDAYNGVGGNHGGDRKYEAAIKYRVIPLTEMIEKDL